MDTIHPLARHFRQKLIQTKFSADLSHPHFHGNRHCTGQDKTRTTNPVHIAKDRANANERKLMPVLSLLFHTELLRQSSTSIYHSNLGIKTKDSNHQKYRG